MPRLTREQLIKLQKRYKTDNAIGAIFGITRQAIHQLRNRYGIVSVAEKNRERNQEMAKLFQSDVAGTELAAKFEISVSQVYRILNDLHKKQKGPAKS
jgi:DNA invertase Pin-like site-specific DNA recombinase